MLERDAEIGELHSLLDEARAGAGRLVVVEGAAGIGKTVLLRALAQHGPVRPSSRYCTACIG